MPKTIIRHLSIKALLIFTCEDCGREEQGDSILRGLAVECSSEEAGELIAEALRKDSYAHRMPERWSSEYGATRTIYRCPSCTARRYPRPRAFP